MSKPTPPELPDALGDYRNWKPEHQQRALELLKEREGASWRPFYCANPICDGNPHDKWEWQHARSDQRPPRWKEEWLTWVLKGGRGSGKTRTGSETTHRVTKIVPRIILIAPTGYDLRETMVEGVSGILATAPPGQRPLWEPSKKKLTWPNGCIGQGFSAEEPDRLRGPQSGFIWGDEPAHWPLVEECWSNMLFGLRMGDYPKVVATSTPKPTKWMKELLAKENTVTHTVSTYANLINLAPTFRQQVIERFEGTRLGRQELHGEVLEDVEGAMWQWEMIEWVDDAPDHMDRIVVSVDPAGTTNTKSDDTGIIVIGIKDKILYVLADYTGKYSPGGWATKVWQAVEDFQADAVVAEKNYGGDMVKHTLESHAPTVAARIKMVTSRRGKVIRAEPIVALYEKHRVKHVGKRGDLSDLEEEQTTWIPGEGASPNRVDALVHGATELARVSMPVTIADPSLLTQRGPVSRHLRAV